MKRGFSAAPLAALVGLWVLLGGGFAMAQPYAITLLSNASATGPQQGVPAGDYRVWASAGAFNGASVALVGSAGGNTSTLATISGVTAPPTHVCVGAGELLTPVVTGGPPVGLNVVLAGDGPCVPASSGGGGGGGAVTAADGAFVNLGSLGDAAYSGSNAATQTALGKAQYNLLNSILSNSATIVTNTNSLATATAQTTGNSSLSTIASHQPGLNGDGGALAHVANFPANQQVNDTNSAAYAGEVAMTVGTTYAVQRSLKANCTAAGNVNYTYGDGSTGSWIVAVGTNTWPGAITAVNSSGTTATCTYAELK